jgi:hypothetical protein
MTGNMNTGNQNGQSGNSIPPPVPQSIEYFVLIENKQNGPHSLTGLELMMNQNKIDRNTLVWRQGMSDWGNIMEQDDLRQLFERIPPPPPKA